MDSALFLLLGLIAGIIAGISIGWVLRSRKGLPTDAGDLAVRAATAEARISGKDEQISSLERMIAELRETNDRRVAEDVERAKEEHKVLEALAPVKETLQAMQTKVNDLENQRQEQYGQIAQQLTESRQFGEELRATTQSLASALSSNSVRGTWGEAQLRRLVEVAGLTAHVDFDTQTTMKTDSGTIRPDMVINLPGGKTIVIDAKVPFNSYLEASQIPITATGEEAAR
ncbi:DNA recombination protein RmuC, partial [uncultured Aurantimicrobium sp.]|uniref:DNA recombination protein RmuC n=1 Tax=uncultured Aurantimicrobium sp. TaxID=1705357 RepID=UPI00261CC1BD